MFICRLLDESFEEVIAIQRALRELAASADPLYSKQHEDFFIGFEGRLVTMDYFSQFCNIFCKVNFLLLAINSLEEVGYKYFISIY